MVINRNKMYQRFREIMSGFLVFSTNDILKYFKDFDKKNLIYWQKKGYLIKIRNNYYCFAEIEKSEAFLYFVANKIYSPSYLSFETALSYYNIIPEGVYTLTSVTSLKTNNFLTPLVNCSYRSLKPNLFFGFKLIAFQNHFFKMACLEKSVLDYLYLHHQLNDPNDFEALRWNKEVLQNINITLLNKYLKLFDSMSLSKRVQIFLNYIHAKS